MAVNEWLNSGLMFHTMRDHVQHGTEILGGMWGARMDTGSRTILEEAMKKLIKDVRKHL